MLNLNKKRCIFSCIHVEGIPLPVEEMQMYCWDENYLRRADVQFTGESVLIFSFYEYREYT